MAIFNSYVCLPEGIPSVDAGRIILCLLGDKDLQHASDCILTLQPYKLIAGRCVSNLTVAEKGFLYSQMVISLWSKFKLSMKYNPFMSIHR
jgi:hypothetical protein